MKTDQIFKYPLFLLGAKPGNKFYEPALKTLQLDVEKYSKSPALQQAYSSLRSYLLDQNQDDADLKSASQLLGTYSPEEVITAYKNVEKHRYSNGIQLMTAHTSKGLEFDEVTLSPKMEASIAKQLGKIAQNEPLTREDKEAIYLYYVAVTRAKVKLNGADYLNTIAGKHNDSN
jgi:superfamily I DNA/RNA helicase